MKPKHLRPRLLAAALLCWLALPNALAQQEHRSGLLTSVNLNKKLRQSLAFNFKAENRLLFWHGDGLGLAPWNPTYERVDLASTLLFPLGLGLRGGAGYMFRTLPGASLHRFSAQATRSRALHRGRLGHRYLADLSLRDGRAPSWRLRYRPLLELPLAGDAVDPGELYLKLGPEALGIAAAGELGWEARALLNLGLQTAPGQMLELGLDFRWAGVQSQALEEGQYWLTLSWFASW